MAILELAHVTRRFGGLVATNDISFSVDEGEVLFIIGPNGAGKTTIFNLVNGYIHPDSGSIRFLGNDISHLPTHKAAKLGIARTFQIVKPLRSLTVLDNVMLGAFLHTRSTAKARQESIDVLRFLEMQDLASLFTSGLPTATLKRLEIARALAMRPKLLLLDEVVAGLPTTEALALAKLLGRLSERGVATVAGIEHVLQVVMQVADRVIVLDHGAKIAEGTPKEVVELPNVIEAYLGVKKAIEI